MQSMQGVHLLFDNKTIARILKTPTEKIDFFSFENMDRIQNLFTELIKRESIFAKLNYLESLDEESFEILLRTYFHIVDSTALSALELKH